MRPHSMITNDVTHSLPNVHPTMVGPDPEPSGGPMLTRLLFTQEGDLGTRSIFHIAPAVPLAIVSVPSTSLPQTTCTISSSDGQRGTGRHVQLRGSAGHSRSRRKADRRAPGLA
jgi:hypothetical protein